MNNFTHKPGTLLRIKVYKNFFSAPHWSKFSGLSVSQDKYHYSIPGDLLMFVGIIDAKEFNLTCKFVVVFLHEEKLVWDGLNNNHIDDLMFSLEEVK